jgi:hypothetical protein
LLFGRDRSGVPAQAIAPMKSCAVGITHCFRSSSVVFLETGGGQTSTARGWRSGRRARHRGRLRNNVQAGWPGWRRLWYWWSLDPIERGYELARPMSVELTFVWDP